MAEQMPPQVGQQFIDDYTPLVNKTASYWGRQYSAYVDVDDVASELWVYLFQRWQWVLDLIEDRGEQRAAGKLRLRLADVARGVCIDAHNEKHGIRREDNTWYTTDLVSEALSDALEHDQWVWQGEEGDRRERATVASPEDASTRLAILADIAHTFRKLNADDQEILTLRYVRDLSAADCGDQLGITEEAAAKRGERALDRFVAKLGGTPPIWPDSRRSVSNAAARTRARLEYDT